MVHDFAEDTIITFSHKSLKKANKFISNDLSLLVHSSELTESLQILVKQKLFHFGQKIKRLPRILILELVGKK